MFEDIGSSIARLSNEFGEDNDCTVRALAVCLGGDYAKAHYQLAALGRKNGKGLNMYIWERAYENLGLALDEVTNNFHGKSIRAVCKELKALDDDACYLLLVRGHVAAWDGKSKELVDWARGRLHRIKGIWRVRKATDPVVHEAPAPLFEYSDKRDVIFITPGKNDSRLRIMIRENGKVRHLQDKWNEWDAEDAANMAAARRGIVWIGYVRDYQNELLDDYSDYDFNHLD